MKFVKKHKIISLILLIISFFVYKNYTRIVPLNPKINKSSKQYVNNLYMSDGRIYNNYLDSTEQKMYMLILKNTKNHKRTEKVSIKNYPCTSPESCLAIVTNAHAAILADHPELIGYSSLSVLYDSGTMTITLDFATNIFQENLGLPVIERMIYDIKQATKNMSDIEKIDYVYNWIGKNTKYDYVFTYASKNQSIYNVFIKKNAVCAGFAKASQVIFQNIGIESYIVTGTSTGPHMWNIVKYKDKYYYFDSTIAAATNKSKDGLIQEKMNDYIMNNPKWYPEIEKTRMQP